MDRFTRYGIYMVPEGALYRAGSDWLGWDSAAGQAVPHPDLPNLPLNAEALTATPRKYGIHGTIKPPFRLAEGCNVEGLKQALAAFTANAPAITLPKLALRPLGRFLALVPETPSDALADLAAKTVRNLDPFRAPATEAELAKRRKKRLSPRQDALLMEWGYPYVMEEFRFHITLTGPLEPGILEPAQTALTAHFAPFLGQPCQINSLGLMGEDAEGRFHLIHRYTLTG